MAKSTKTTVTQRVEEILTMRLAGAAFVEIRRNASEKEWGISDRQLERYIQASDKLLAQSLEPSRKKRINLHLAQRRLLLNRTLETGDYRTALAVLRDMALLQGLYPSAKPAAKETDPNALSALDEYFRTVAERKRQQGDAEDPVVVLARTPPPEDPTKVGAPKSK